MGILVKELPYPPSDNNYYGRTPKGYVYIKPEGKAHRLAVIYCLKGHKPFEGIVKLHVDVFPPDNRIRDITNLNKCLLDSIEASGVLRNDCQVKKFSMEENKVITGGKVIVTIENISRKEPIKGDYYDYDAD